MNDTPRQTVQQQQANLAALHHYLQELARHVKRTVPVDVTAAVRLSGPALVIRGK